MAANNADHWFAVLIVDTLHEKRPLIKKTQNPILLLNSLNNELGNSNLHANDEKEQENLNFFSTDANEIQQNHEKLHSSSVSLLSFPTDTFMKLSNPSTCIPLKKKKNSSKKKRPKTTKKKIIFVKQNTYCAKCRGIVGELTQPSWNVNGRYKIGQINGPFATEMHVEKFVSLWLTGTRGTISKAARAEILSQYFDSECYGDLGVIFFDKQVYDCLKCVCHSM